MSSRANFTIAGEYLLGAVLFQAGNGETPDNEGAVDRTPATHAEFVCDLLEAETLLSKCDGFVQAPTKAHFVMSHMVSLGHDFQVGQIVVEPISVPMMDELCWFEFPTYSSLHDDAMFKAVLGDPVLGDADASIGRVRGFLYPAITGSTSPAMSSPDVAEALHLSILPIADAGSQ